MGVDQMSSLADLRPGDIGFGPIKGGAGMLVNAGQLLLGEGFRVGRLNIKHVFVITEALHDEGPSEQYPTGVINKGSLVEAMPSGAHERPIMLDRWTADYAYVGLPEDYPGQADDAAAIARAMVGTPYSFASYAALAAWRFGISTPRLEKWIGRRRPLRHMPMSGPVPSNLPGRHIALPCEAICSVLADQAWSLAGKKIFEDARPHQCVTPGALAIRLLSYPGAQWIWPGA
jgi:hypothetical protein